MTPPAEPPVPPSVGLALGGGGARGLAHVGLLKVLTREGIPINYIAGTSMGGILGALYCIGMPLDQIEAEATRIGARRTMLGLADIQISQTGLLRGARIQAHFANLIGAERTFAELTTPLAIVAADMNSGREIVFQEGLVIDALRASMSVPGVFRPYELGPYRLVDGGILNNVPTNVVRRMGATVVIAQDVLPHYSLNVPGEPPLISPMSLGGLPRLYNDFWQIESIMVSAITELRMILSPPDVLIWPNLPTNLGLFLGFDRAHIAIHAGEEAAEQALPRIRAALERGA